jgi:hypothetical protein
MVEPEIWSKQQTVGQAIKTIETALANFKHDSFWQMIVVYTVKRVASMEIMSSKVIKT